MKHLLCILCLGMVGLTAAAKGVKLTIGPLQQNHERYPVVLYLSDYPEFSPIERTQLGVYKGGKEIASQLDDINGDGTPDELAFLVDIKAGERINLAVKPAKKHKSFEKEVYAEMYLKSKTPQEGYTFHEAEGKQFYITPVTEQTFYPGEDSYNSMHHHGVAFESDLMAYRIYFDKKQTIDIYAKKTPRLEIEDCKWYPTDEQLAQGFGDDILRVSGYIGVGACKPFNGQKMVHFDDVLARTERIVSQGNIRTICEIIDDGWKVANNRRVRVVTRYTLYAGHRDVLVEVFFSEPIESMCTGVQRIGKANYFSAVPERYATEKDTLVNGQNIKVHPVSCRNGGVVASWGTAFPVNDSVKYGKETVGLAVYVPEIDYRSHMTDANNNLIRLQPGNYIRYYFTVVGLKENNPPATTDEEFWQFVLNWANSLED